MKHFFNQILQFLDFSSNIHEFIRGLYYINTIIIKDSNGMPTTKFIATLFPKYRAILAFLLVSIFMLIMLCSEELITKVCEWLVYPLCAVLFIFSVYLIPQWKFDSIAYMPDFKEFLTIVWLILPVLVFSFNHSPAISAFSLSVKRYYKKDYVDKADQILFRTSVMLLVFVMFFCVLSLNPEKLKDTRSQNILIFSYFANKFDNLFISYGRHLVAFLAIASSFFGHYFGVRE